MIKIKKQPDSHLKLMPIKKILIALDYDKTAQKVAETGYSLAKALNAEVILMHVIDDKVYYSSLEYSPIMGFSGFDNMDLKQLIDTDGLRQAAQYFLDKSKQHLGDETIQTLIAEGDFAPAILKAANDLQADIIVIGSHSRRGLNKILMGSVAEKVLHHTSVPLYVVPTKDHK